MNLEKRRKRQESIRKQYDKTAKNLPPVSIGDKIYFNRRKGKNGPKVKLSRILVDVLT